MPATLARPTTPTTPTTLTRRRPALIVTAALLVLGLAGCGSHGTSGPAATGAGSGTSAGSAGAQAGSQGGKVSQQAADQIEGAVNDAQSTLDGLDKDFDQDDASTAGN